MSYLKPAVFVQTTDKTIANTTSETSLLDGGIGSLTLQPNLLQTGKAILLTIRGIVSDTGTPSTTVRVKLGSTTLVTSTQSLPSGLSNASFEMVFQITCRAGGSSGSIMGQGRTIFNSNNGITTASMRSLQMTSPVTIDLTTSLLLDLTYQWGTAHASNTITACCATLEILN